jgi:hypothetical protein
MLSSASSEPFGEPYMFTRERGHRRVDIRREQKKIKNRMELGFKLFKSKE